MTQGLTSLLSYGDEGSSVEQIVSIPAMLAEARRSFPALRAFATAPAGEAGVRRVIEPRFATYPQPKRTEAEAAAWWADYFDALSDLPPASIEEGMKAWIRNPESEFLPKPGRLRELARQATTRPAAMALRADKAIRLADSRRPAEEARGQRDRPSREQVQAMMADFRREMAAKRAPEPPKPPLPPPPVGKLAEGYAVTAELARKVGLVNEMEEAA